MSLKGLDDYITHDWREDEEFNPDCKFYDENKDICTFKCYDDSIKIFGEGCLGKHCKFYKK